jgi:PAS domain S-box-containing protein
MLRRSEERYRFLVENLIEGIGIVDPDEDIVYVNPAFCRICGYTKDELLKLNLRDIMPPEEFDRTRLQTEKRTRGESGEYVTTMIHKTRGPRAIRVHATPYLDREGNFLGTLGLIEDITEQLEAQQSLEQRNREVESLLAEKELLLKEVHHRVKNDMSFVRSMLSLQSQDTEHEEARRALEAAGERVSAVGRVYESLYRGNIYSLHLNQFLEKLVGELTANMKPHIGGVTIDCDDTEISPRLSRAIATIVNELLANAAKYARPRNGGPSVSIEGSRHNGASLRLRIRDDGEGFPASVTAGERPGFGLSVIEAMVAQYGGNLDIHNDNGGQVTVELALD